MLSFDVCFASPLSGELDYVTSKLLFKPDVPRASAAGGIMGGQTGSSDKEQGFMPPEPHSMPTLLHCVRTPSKVSSVTVDEGGAKGTVPGGWRVGGFLRLI